MVIKDLLPADAQCKLLSEFASLREMIRTMDHAPLYNIGFEHAIENLIKFTTKWLNEEATDKEGTPVYENKLENNFICPCCDNIVISNTDDFEMDFEDFPKFCSECGVKIDWDKDFMKRCYELYVNEWWCESQDTACKHKNKETCDECWRYD